MTLRAPPRGVLVPLVVGVVAGLASLAAAAVEPRRMLLAWIAAYGFAAATIISALVLVMALYVTGARWWLVLRRVFLATAGTAPLLILLFVPIGAAFTIVYPWASPPPGLTDTTMRALEHQRAWNNGPFFLARAALYLATWTGFAVLLRRADPIADEATSFAAVVRQRKISAVGLPVLGFTLTFASFDWLMALQPAWTSNVFGLFVFTSGLISALCVVAIGTWAAAPRGLVDGVRPDHVHAVGRLLLMAVILWAYIGFFQLMLTWIADIPHEVTFYAARAHGAWAITDVLLFVARFAVPFLLLLSRPLKRDARTLAAIATWLLLTSVLEFAWITLPATEAGLVVTDWLPFVTIIALFWSYGAHLATLGTRPPAPAPHPVPEDALRYRSP